MTLNDPLSNALSAVLNAERIGRKEVAVKPKSNLLQQILFILNMNQYLGDVQEVEDGKGNFFVIPLLGMINACGAIKPRMSVTLDTYEKFEKRFLIAKGFGIIIVSTSQGIMTHHEAKQRKLGGRLLAYCY